MEPSHDFVASVQNLVLAVSILPANSDGLGPLDDLLLHSRQEFGSLVDPCASICVDDVLSLEVLYSTVVVDQLEDWVFGDLLILFAKSLCRGGCFDAEETFIDRVSVFADFLGFLFAEASSEDVIELGDDLESCEVFGNIQD